MRLQRAPVCERVGFDNHAQAGYEGRNGGSANRPLFRNALDQRLDGRRWMLIGRTMVTASALRAPSVSDPPALLRAMFDAAVAAADEGRVEAGEEITITLSGRPSARLVPSRPAQWRSWSELANLFRGPADRCHRPRTRGSALHTRPMGVRRPRGPGRRASAVMGSRREMRVWTRSMRSSWARSHSS